MLVSYGYPERITKLVRYLESNLAAKRYEIFKESSKVWKIISPAGKLYYVFLRNDRYVCTCSYFNQYPRPCKHLKMVHNLESKKVQE